MTAETSDSPDAVAAGDKKPSQQQQPSAHHAGHHHHSVLLSRYVRWLDQRGGKYVVVLVWLAIVAVGIAGVVQTFPSLKLAVRRTHTLSPAPLCLRLARRCHAS